MKVVEMEKKMGDGGDGDEGMVTVAYCEVMRVVCACCIMVTMMVILMVILMMVAMMMLMMV